MSGTGEQSETTEAPKAEAADENGDGTGESLSVAAAIGVNIHTASYTASIPDDRIVNVAGTTTVHTTANTDGFAVADGSSATADGGTTVGAAAALNVVKTTNSATVGKASVTSAGLTVEAGMADRKISITSTSTRTVDVKTDTIFVGDVSDLSEGDQVTYSPGTGSISIGGLTADATYFVSSLEDGRIKLSDSNGGDAIDLTSTGTGTHQLSRFDGQNPTIADKHPIKFDPSEEQLTIVPDGGAGLATGDEVVYNNGGGSDIGGLTSGTTYFAIVKDNGNIELASSSNDAAEGKAEEIKSLGSGEDHTLTESIHRASASATSGASGGKTGIAGALAINVATTDVTAEVKGGATVTLLTDSDLKLDASSTTQTTTTAAASQEGGDTLGVGASIALGIAKNDTLAKLDDGAKLIGAANVSLESTSAHTTSTESQGGAEASGEGIAITPVVAIALAFNDTNAELGTGESLTVTGDVSVKANQENESTASGEGSASAKAAVGAALGLTVAEDSATASINRNVTSSGGKMLISSEGSAVSLSSSKAGANGVKEDEEGSADDDMVNQQSQAQLDYGNQRAMSSTGEQSTTTEAPKAEAADENSNSETGEGTSLSVAAAIGVNIHTPKFNATIAEGLTIDADGSVIVQTNANTDGAAVADGSSATAENGNSVGAAVALNVINTTNTATVGASVTADGLVIEANMSEREIALQPSVTKTVDVETDTILVGDVSDLSEGDQVTYRPGTGNTAIGGLTSNQMYFVISLEEGRIKLSDTADGDAIDLKSFGSGNRHRFTRGLEKDPVDFKPSEEHFSISLDGGTGLATGDAVVYHRGAGDNIGGLKDGTTYYAIIDGSGAIQLAKTYDDALDGSGEKITSVGTGEEHSITESSHSTRTTAISGASGGKIGVAGSLAINVANGTTEALLESDANARLRDGSDDDDTTADDVRVSANATTNNSVTATPHENASGSSLGVGLSVGVNVGNHDTRAEIEGSAVIEDAHHVSLKAVGSHTLSTSAKSGASSDKTAVAGAVAIGISDSDTTARVTTGGAALDISGDLSLMASGAHTQKSTADGETAGEGVGVGLSFALSVVEDDVLAVLQRDVSTNADVTAGNITVDSNSVITVGTESSAGAKGAEDSDEEGDTADAETTRQTNFAKQRGGLMGNKDVSVPTAGDRVETANSEAVKQTTDPGGDATDDTVNSTGTDATSETKGASVKVAAAIGASVLTPNVKAEIADGLTIQSSGNVNVKAIADADATTLATGLAVADEATGVGAAVTVNVASLDTTASVGSGTLNAGSLHVEAGTPKDNTSDFKLRSLAGGKSQGSGGTVIAGSVGVNVVDSDVKATIKNDATVNAATGSVDVAARNDVGIQTLVGGGAISTKAIPDGTTGGTSGTGGTGTTGGTSGTGGTGTTGGTSGTGGTGESGGNAFGAAIGVNLVSNTSVATIGAGANVDGNEDVTVDAKSSVVKLDIDFPDFPVEDLKELIAELGKAIVPKVSMVVAGAGASAGGTGVAGSAAVSVIDVTTTAEIEAGAKISKAKDVTVRAADHLAFTHFVGALAAGLTKGGFGAGLDVIVVVKDTTASIAASHDAAIPTSVTGSDNVTVEATSDEDIFSLTVNIGIGRSAAVAGGAVVVVQNNDTRAFIGDDPKAAAAGIATVTADGSIHVAADSKTAVDAAAGTVAGASGSSPTDPASSTGGSGGKSVGGSVAVVVDLDTTEAFVGTGVK